MTEASLSDRGRGHAPSALAWTEPDAADGTSRIRRGGLAVALCDPSHFTWPYDRALAQGLEACHCHVRIYGPGDTAAKDPEAVRAPSPLAVDHYYPFASRIPDKLQRFYKAARHTFDHYRLLRRLNAQTPRPDVIHFQWLAAPLLDGPMLPRLAKLAPLVLTLHDTTPHNGSPSLRLRIQASGLKGCLKNFARVIVHSAHSKDQAEKIGVPPGKLVVIPHGSLVRPSASGARGRAADGSVEFLMFGKIQHYKGLDLLVEALGLLPAAVRSRLHVRVVGKPYYDLGTVLARARALGLLEPQDGAAQCLTVEPRFVPETEIDDLFGACDAVLAPYRAVDASGVLSIAQAYGRPVIGTRVGGIAETVAHEQTGLLCDPGSARSLAQQIGRFVQDSELREMIAQGANGLQCTVPDWVRIAQITIEEAYLPVIARQA